MPLIGANGGLIGAARTSRRGAAVGLWTPNEQVVYQRQNAWIGDANFANVSLLLHMDGANGSTTFTDSSSNVLTVTRFGDAQISTAQSRFGGASALFDGTGDYLRITDSALFDLSTGATIEAWVYFTSIDATYRAIVYKGTSGINESWWLGVSSTSVKVGTNNSYSDLTVTGLTFTTGQWYHVAMSYQVGTGTKIFVNGAMVGSSTLAITNSGSADITIGCITWNNPVFFMTGYIDDLRITKGVARYTSNFTPPTAPFPDL